MSSPEIRPGHPSPAVIAGLRSTLPPGMWQHFEHIGSTVAGVCQSASVTCRQMGKWSENPLWSGVLPNRNGRGLG